MSYKAIFKGWDELTLQDLIVAYRKAKADCFFENTFPTAIHFSEYEQDLLKNLNSLLNQIKANKGFLNRPELTGKIRITPKKLRTDPKKDKNNSHIHFSDPDRAFSDLCDKNDVVPEFRLIGDFPVNAHVLSALWINMIGHKFDACLDDFCYGARLRRIKNEEELDFNADKLFHISCIGSFAPYFQPYQNWRSDGLKAIRDELDKNKDVIAASLDIKSYYHFIDPKMIAEDFFQEEIGLSGSESLTEQEKDFTSQLAIFLAEWSEQATEFANIVSTKDDVPGGLVIGLTASRIISNVLLIRWDKKIKEELAPIHYGRYVDDMFLVLRDPGIISSIEDLMVYIQERLGKHFFYKDSKSDTEWIINQGEEFQKDSEIRLQPEKQKIFILQGQAGKDLLDSIEKEIIELSSEHRLMPYPDQLEDSTAAKVLSAGEQADNLRRVDSLTIRRLSWSLQLRHVESLARDLPSENWKKQRNDFYQFAHNHILRPDSVFSQYSYLPRLLGFAISLNEWTQAEAIVKRTFDSIERLENITTENSNIAINGVECSSTNLLWPYVKGTLTWLFIDAAARYYDHHSLLVEEPSRKVSQLAQLFLDQLYQELQTAKDIFSFEFGGEDFYSKAPLVAMCDLAKEPYKNILASNSASGLLGNGNKESEHEIFKEFASADLVNTDDLVDFLRKSRKNRLEMNFNNKKSTKRESLLPYIFPTRPYTPTEISELAPQSVGLVYTKNRKPSEIWARYVRSVRGVWVKPTLIARETDKPETKPSSGNNLSLLNIGTKQKEKIIATITNIKTDDYSWSRSASGSPDLSLNRYKRIADIVNQSMQLIPKPDYVIFPELSIPIEWASSIANRLNKSNISLIAGTEYRHKPKDEIFSEAFLQLTDDRLGFNSSVRIWQPKLEPAVGEDKELFSVYGKTWFFNKKRIKPLYIHNGFHFGVMICSELQNSKARIKFQGNVDSLVVLSWNQDLDTFSSLIESTALDVHAYTLLINNRKFGDSRARSPAKESYLRDLARLRGGDNDYCVAVTLDIDSLRKFQSRAKRWPQLDDMFKPVPEGYKIIGTRKKSPPG